jgi:hypothetical protein
MTRRNQKRYSNRNRENNNDKQLVKMLDLRKLNYFRYDATEILDATEIEQKTWNPMLASIVTKASRMSIKDANEYINELENEGIMDKETAKAISRLLDKYKRWR